MPADTKIQKLNLFLRDSFSPFCTMTRNRRVFFAMPINKIIRSIDYSETSIFKGEKP
ncbi:MAG: hypothetical protein ACI82Z_001723 [Cellvibrionaceae bacterium]|jgi:hypothetical protein